MRCDGPGPGGRRKRLVASVSACLLLAAASGRARAQGGFSDEAVERAIARGVKSLWSAQKKDGSWEEKNVGSHGPYTVGPSAICTYALLASGARPSDKRMARALAFLEKTKADRTYCLAFRALAYAAAVRHDPKYKNLLRRDVRQLLRSVDRFGGYTYVSRGSPPRRSDFTSFAGGSDRSNTQYGLLGVWAGAMHDLEVPRQYWAMSLDYWRRTQSADGGWGYSAKGKKSPYMAMTLAGLASVFVCYDNLYSLRFVLCRGNARFPSAERALVWVQKHFADTGKRDQHYYYTLYGVERVGLASGYKFFGKHDWYKRGATALIRAQAGGKWKANGSHTGGDNTTTSYALLFLLRGRRPVLFNRLEYEGDWNNRPRALANLTRWFSRTFERGVHWQIINLKTPVEDWHDAPILCLTGTKEPTFSEKDLAKIRTFVWQGGSIFSITECNGKGFREGIRKVYKKLFPTCEMQELKDDHEIYSAYHPLRDAATFHEVSNGARPLAIHTDDDLANPWQGRRHLSAKKAYQAAVNVVAYTNDKLALAGGLRFRGTTLWPAQPGGKARHTVRLIRLRHAGNCDPEPLAHQRFARLMASRLGVKVELPAPILASELPASGARLAVLTGTEAFALAAGEKSALKAWIEKGGTLLIDAAGGAKAFRDSAEVLLREMFGRRAVRQLAGSAPLYRIPGFEIPRAHYRRRTRDILGKRTEPSLRGVLVGQRTAVLFSREDITAGLVGYPSYTVYGYAPETAFQILRNVVLQAYGLKLGKARPAPPARRPRPRASRNAADAGLAVDGKRSTRWKTGRPMKAGDWFAVDLGQTRTISRIVLDAGEAKDDYPRGYKVYVSADGKDWGKSVLTGKDRGVRITIRLKKAARARHVRIVQTGSHDKWHWSIAELKVE